MSENWIPTRILERLENKRQQRSIIGWSMAGGCYKHGHKLPGHVHLNLSGGGWLYYPENTPLDVAFADADDRGFNTTDARAKLDAWIKAGKGVSFSLEER